MRAFRESSRTGQLCPSANAICCSVVIRRTTSRNGSAALADRHPKRSTHMFDHLASLGRHHAAVELLPAPGRLDRSDWRVRLVLNPMEGGLADEEFESRALSSSSWRSFLTPERAS